MYARIAAAVLLTVASVAHSARAEVEVITSPDRAEVVLDRSLLRALFTMRVRQWPDGTAARVFVLPDNAATHDRFCREILGTYPYVLRNTWDRGVFTGTGFAPERVGSEAEMLDKVRRTRGAIGYVDRRPSSWLPVYLTSVLLAFEGETR